MDGNAARIAFNTKYSSQVGVLAETIVAATMDDQGCGLCDPDSSWGAVFLECVALYRREHGLDAAIVSAAVAEWRELATSDAYSWD